jgi:hypothetical protein
MSGLSNLALAGIVAGVVFVGGLVSGIKLEGWRCQAKETAALKAAAQARQVDESFTQGVSVAYEQVAAQLRRMTTVNRVELTREVQKVEYRCPVPDDARRLLNDGIRAANAATGQPDPAVPADPAAGGAEPRRTGDSLFGTDGDLR